MKHILAAIAKDEPEIDNWVSHHLNIGYDQIVVMTNSWEWNSKFEDKVIVLEWNKPAPFQLDAYYWVMKNIQFKTITFLDCDEYINSSVPFRPLLDSLVNCLALPWRMHGNKEVDGSTIVERFPYWGWDNNGHYKSVIPNKYKSGSLSNAHAIKEFTYSPEGQMVRGGTGCNKSNIAWVDHYYYQDFEYWKRKVERGRPDVTFKRPVHEWCEGEFYNQNM